MTKFAILLTLVLAVPAFAAEYSVDDAHSHVGFSVRHLVGRVPGEFKSFEGKYSFDEKDPSKAMVDFEIKAASISTDNAKRDGHLQSPDFFDVKKFPKLTFKSTKLTPAGDKMFKLEGDLTMHGVTKPVTWDVEYGGTAKGMMGEERSGFTAKTRINRKDFGIVWNKTLDQGGLALGDDVDVELNIEGMQKK
jgi:polyisoprenoid-binding protein YceI